MIPKITVIIPNYNHVKYLPQRIESVLKQTVQDIEVLLLDDCSTDNSRQVIAHYAQQDARIRVIPNERNSGNTFAQWNKGFAHATGEYVWIAESDDYADPMLLETLSQVMEQNPSVGLAYCDSWHVDVADKCIALHTRTGIEFQADSWLQGFVSRGQDFIEKYLSNGNVIPNASAVLLRRNIIQEVGLANTSFRLSGDWVYWIRVLVLCDVAFVARPLNFFRRHNNNVRSKTARVTVLLEGAKMIKRLRRHVSLGSVFEERRAKQIIRLCFNAMLYENMKLAKVKKVLAVLRKALPNYRTIFVKEAASILLSNRFSGMRQLLGDGLIYKVFRRKEEAVSLPSPLQTTNLKPLVTYGQS